MFGQSALREEITRLKLRIENFEEIEKIQIERNEQLIEENEQLKYKLSLLTGQDDESITPQKTAISASNIKKGKE